MKQLKLLVILLFIGSTLFAQVKISDMPTNTKNPTGGWIPLVLDGKNEKVDAGKFYNKLDNMFRKDSTDSVFIERNGIKNFAFRLASGDPYVPQLTIAETRGNNIPVNSKTNQPNSVIYITDKNKEGMFRYVEPITSNPTLVTDDDGVMTIIATNGTILYKYERIVGDYINAMWFWPNDVSGTPMVNGLKLNEANYDANNVSHLLDLSEAARVFNLYSSDHAEATSLIYPITTAVTPTDPMADWRANTVDWFTLQTAINYVASGKSKSIKLFVPSGNYQISRELFARRYDKITVNGNNVNDYTDVMFILQGESSFHPAAYQTRTIITALFSDKFALGIQHGKGCKISGIEFTGKFELNSTYAHIQSEHKRDLFSSSINTNDAIYNYNRFFANNCKDRTNAPYAAVVIDPFKRYPYADIANIYHLNTNDYYSELNYFYQGTGSSTGGSTGIEISDVVINQFVAGIVISPNYNTYNAEFMKIEKVQLNTLKYGIVGGQHQEKTNTIKHISAEWTGPVHTVFFLGQGEVIPTTNPKTTWSMGEGFTGQYKIEDVNIANGVVQLTEMTPGGWFNCSFNNIYAEELGKIGYISGGAAGVTFENSSINFAFPDFNNGHGPQSSIYQSYHIDGSGVTFKNTQLRFNDNKRTPICINGANKFENCSFNTVPFFLMTSDVNIPTFTNCITEHEGGLGVTGIQNGNKVHFIENVAYGNFILQDASEDGSSQGANKTQFKYSEGLPYRTEGGLTITLNNRANYGVGYFQKIADLNNNPTGEIILRVSRTDFLNCYQYLIDRMILVQNNNINEPLGVLRSATPISIGTFPNFTTYYDLRIVGVDQNKVSMIFSGNTINIMGLFPVETIQPFLGDYSSETPQLISNVIIEGVTTPSSADIIRYQSNYEGKILLLKNVPFSGPNQYQNWCLISKIDYNSSANNWTFHLYKTLETGQSKSAIYFCNGCEKSRQTINIYGGGNGTTMLPENEILQEGMKVSMGYGSNGTFEDRVASHIYKVIKSGFFNATNASTTYHNETRQAEIVPEYNYNNHADARFYGGNEIYFEPTTTLNALDNAKTQIATRDRKEGMSVLLKENGTISEYWFNGGIDNTNLVLKNAATVTVNSGWALNGNNKIDPTCDGEYIGTKNGADLRFKTNVDAGNTNMMRLDVQGNLSLEQYCKANFISGSQTSFMVGLGNSIEGGFSNILNGEGNQMRVGSRNLITGNRNIIVIGGETETGPTDNLVSGTFNYLSGSATNSVILGNQLSSFGDNTLHFGASRRSYRDAPYNQLTNGVTNTMMIGWNNFDDIKSSLRFDVKANSHTLLINGEGIGIKTALNNIPVDDNSNTSKDLPTARLDVDASPYAIFTSDEINTNNTNAFLDPTDERYIDRPSGVRFRKLPFWNKNIEHVDKLVGNVVIDEYGYLYQDGGDMYPANLWKEAKNLQNKVAVLEEEIKLLKVNQAKNEETLVAENKLFQNAGNIIDYIVVGDINNYLNITSLDGQIIKTFKINNKGKGSIDISAKGFTAGTYTYSLYSNGVLIDTKLIIISKQ